MKVLPVLLLFLTGTLAIPFGYSNAQDSNGTGTPNESVGIQDNISITKTSASSNQNGTSSNTTTANQNQTSSSTTVSTQNIIKNTNIGQQVSSFVHNATALFQLQRNETMQAVKECQQNIKSATTENRTQAINDCHTALITINKQYQTIRAQFQELFKQFRQSIIVLRHDAETHNVSNQTRDDAVKNIGDNAEKHGFRGINATALDQMKKLKEHEKAVMENEREHGNETSNENTAMENEMSHGNDTRSVSPEMENQMSHGNETSNSNSEMENQMSHGNVTRSGNSEMENQASHGNENSGRNMPNGTATHSQHASEDSHGQSSQQGQSGNHRDD